MLQPVLMKQQTSSFTKKNSKAKQKELLEEQQLRAQLEKLYPKSIAVKARSAQRSQLLSDIKLEKSLAMKKEILSRHQDPMNQSVAYDGYKSPTWQGLKAHDIESLSHSKLHNSIRATSDAKAPFGSMRRVSTAQNDHFKGGTVPNTVSKRITDCEVASHQQFMGTTKTSTSVLESSFIGGHQQMYKKTSKLQRLRAHGNPNDIDNNNKTLPARGSLKKNSAFDADLSSRVETDASDYTSQRKFLGNIGTGIDRSKNMGAAAKNESKFMAGRTRNQRINNLKTADELLDRQIKPKSYAKIKEEKQKEFGFSKNIPWNQPQFTQTMAGTQSQASFTRMPQLTVNKGESRNTLYASQSQHMLVIEDKGNHHPFMKVRRSIGRSANTSQKQHRKVSHLSRHTKNYQSKPELHDGTISIGYHRPDTQNGVNHRGNWMTNDRTVYEMGNLQSALGRSLYAYNSQKLLGNDQSSNQYVRNVAAMESAAIRSQLLHDYRQSGVKERHSSTGPTARRNGNTIDLHVMQAEMVKPLQPHNMHVIDGISNEESREYIVNDDLSEDKKIYNFGVQQAITGREDQLHRVNLIDREEASRRRSRRMPIGNNTIDGALEPSETNELSEGISQRVLPSVGGGKGSRMPVLHQVDLSIGSGSTLDRRNTASNKKDQKYMKQRSPSGSPGRRVEHFLQMQHTPDTRKSGSKHVSKRRNVSQFQNGALTLLSSADQLRSGNREPSEGEQLKKKKIIVKDQQQNQPAVEQQAVNKQIEMLRNAMKKMIHKKKEEMGFKAPAQKHTIESSERKVSREPAKAQRIQRHCVVHAQKIKEEAERNQTQDNGHKEGGRNNDRVDEVDAEDEMDKERDIMDDDQYSQYAQLLESTQWQNEYGDIALEELFAAIDVKINKERGLDAKSAALALADSQTPIYNASKAIKQLNFQVNRILSSQDDIVRPVYLDRENRIDLFNNENIYFKLPVNGLQAPLHASIEYYDLRTDRVLEKSKMFQMVSIYASQTVVQPTKSQSQAQFQSPKTFDLFIAGNKGKFPFKQPFFYFTVACQGSNANDSYMMIRFHAEKSTLNQKDEKGNKAKKNDEGMFEAQDIMSTRMYFRAPNLTIFRDFFREKVKLLVDDEVKRAEYLRLLEGIRNQAFVCDSPRKSEQVEEKKPVVKTVHHVEEEESGDGEDDSQNGEGKVPKEPVEGQRKLDELGLEIKEKGLNLTMSMIKGAHAYKPNVTNHLTKNRQSIAQGKMTMEGRMMNLADRMIQRMTSSEAAKARQQAYQLQQYKRKVFMLIKSDILAQIKNEGIDEGFRIYHERTRSQRFIKLIVVLRVVKSLKAQFEAVKAAIEFHKLQVKCVNRLKRSFQRKLLQKGQDLEMRRKHEIRHFFTIASKFQQFRMHRQAKAVLKVYVRQYNEMDRMVQAHHNWYKFIEKLQKMIKNRFKMDKKIVRKIQDIWQKVLNERVSELLNSKKKGVKKSNRAALFALKDKKELGESVAQSWYKMMRIKHSVTLMAQQINLEHMRHLHAMKHDGPNALYHLRMVHKYLETANKWLDKYEIYVEDMGLKKVLMSKDKAAAKAGKSNSKEKGKKEGKEAKLDKRLQKYLIDVQTFAHELDLSTLDDEKMFNDILAEVANEDEGTAAARIEKIKEIGAVLELPEDYVPETALTKCIAPTPIKKIAFNAWPDEKRINMLLDHQISLHLAQNPHLKEADSKDGASTSGKKGKKSTTAAQLSDAPNSTADMNAIAEEVKEDEATADAKDEAGNTAAKQQEGEDAMEEEEEDDE